jgi:SAM-dependent methyltransferase
LPLDSDSVDAATSSFVYQLVPSRYRALRDARRVLRPGGTLGYVTWLAGGRFGADEAYDEALEAAGLEPEDRTAGHEEPDEPGPLVAQLRRAGFAGVSARRGALEHVFTPEGYLEFIARFDDEDRFATLDSGQRAALEADLLRRLRAMDPIGLRMCLPLAYLTGGRSTRP